MLIPNTLITLFSFHLSLISGCRFHDCNRTISEKFCYKRDGDISKPILYSPEKNQNQERISCTRSNCPGSAYNKIKELLKCKLVHNPPKEMERSRMSLDVAEVSTDRDTCCPAEIEFTTPFTLENEHGITRHLVVLDEDTHQIIVKARCRASSYCERCRPATTYHTLLVWTQLEGNEEPAYALEGFYLETHCICEGI